VQAGTERLCARVRGGMACVLWADYFEQLARSEELKAQANKKFQENHFNESFDLYSAAIEQNPLNHVLFANRSFCHIKLENYGMVPPPPRMLPESNLQPLFPCWALAHHEEELHASTFCKHTTLLDVVFRILKNARMLAGSAITDASEAITLEPSYIKSYYRRGSARMALMQYKAARTDFRAACQIEPGNKDARSKLNECEKVCCRSISSSSRRIRRR
jgi:tetratricopeptide (TPR) repeat protein